MPDWTPLRMATKFCFVTADPTAGIGDEFNPNGSVETTSLVFAMQKAMFLA